MEQIRMAKILKILTVCAALVGALFVFWYVPAIILSAAAMYPEAAFLKWPAILGVWVIGILGFTALGLFYRICGRIAADNSFCIENAADMKRIGILAVAAAILLIVGMGILMFTGMYNGAAFIAFFFVDFAGWAFAVLCLALARLTGNAAILKSENDLTI